MRSVAPADNPGSELLRAARRRGRRYRIAAGIILVLGVLSAGLVYWLGSRAPDYSDDPSMLGFNRAADRQMGYLYGKQGQLIEDLTDSLKRPGTQAILIALAAAVVAVGCFYFARMLEHEATEAANDGTP